MKRYRVFASDFDSRAMLLEKGMDKDGGIGKWLIYKYGESNSEIKKQNFIELGPKPFSIIAFHNNFFEQIRCAFVAGDYYPALTGSCALGERILNHLILSLREDYKSTPEYKYVYGKNSFQDWSKAIEILTAWDVLLPVTAEKFRELEKIRNKSIHFNPEIDEKTRELSLGAVKILGEIIDNQFSGFGKQPWFMIVPGAIYIKKEWEAKPFIKKIYLPNCALVGPNHKIKSIMPWSIEDTEYPQQEISDEEFAELLKKPKS
jgi:hypothetical protein